MVISFYLRFLKKSCYFISGNTKSGPLIQHMWDQEKEHLRIFEKLMPKYRARPTALLPFWNVAGFALGAGTKPFVLLKAILPVLLVVYQWYLQLAKITMMNLK